MDGAVWTAMRAGSWMLLFRQVTRAAQEESLPGFQGFSLQISVKKSACMASFVSSSRTLSVEELKPAFGARSPRWYRSSQGLCCRQDKMELNLTGAPAETLCNPSNHREEKVTVLSNMLHRSPTL